MDTCLTAGPCFLATSVSISVSLRYSAGEFTVSTVSTELGMKMDYESHTWLSRVWPMMSHQFRFVSGFLVRLFSCLNVLSFSR